MERGAVEREHSCVPCQTWAGLGPGNVGASCHSTTFQLVINYLIIQRQRNCHVFWKSFQLSSSCCLPEFIALLLTRSQAKNSFQTSAWEVLSSHQIILSYQHQFILEQNYAIGNVCTKSSCPLYRMWRSNQRFCYVARSADLSQVRVILVSAMHFLSCSHQQSTTSCAGNKGCPSLLCLMRTGCTAAPCRSTTVSREQCRRKGHVRVGN